MSIRNSTSYLKSAAMAGLLSLSTIAGAAAGPAGTLTVSPVGAGLSSAPNFSFNGIHTSDFSSINLTSTGHGDFSFTETGFLPIGTFDPGNFTPPGLNGSAGAKPYGIYGAFTASGSLLSVAPGLLVGSFSSLNYTLMGDPGFNDTFNHFTATHQVFCEGCAGDITLANGSLLPEGTNTVLIGTSSPNTGRKPLPAAFADLLFNATDGGFFVDPHAPFTAELDTQFSNTANVTAKYTKSLPAGVNEVVTIGTTAGQGGAGSGQFILPMPEPASLGLLGVGLVALGLVRRTRGQG